MDDHKLINLKGQYTDVKSGCVTSVGPSLQYTPTVTVKNKNLVPLMSLLFLKVKTLPCLHHPRAHSAKFPDILELDS